MKNNLNSLFSNKDRNSVKDLVVIGVGILSFLYLLNLGFGFGFELPDNLPLIGNLDEIGATLILLNVFRYFGVDLLNR